MVSLEEGGVGTGRKENNDNFSQMEDNSMWLTISQKIFFFLVVCKMK